MWQTETAVYEPPAVTQECAQGTHTVVKFVAGQTNTVWTTVERLQWVQNAVTARFQTSAVRWAYCHWPQGQPPPPRQDRLPPQPQQPPPQNCYGNCRPYFGGGSWQWREWQNGNWGNGGNWGGGRPGGGNNGAHGAYVVNGMVNEAADYAVGKLPGGESEPVETVAQG